MKIIKEGKLPQKKIIRITCTNCSTIYEFSEEEICYISYQLDGDYFKIKCPFCGEYNTKACKLWYTD